MFLGVAVSYALYPEIRSVIYNSPVDLVYSPVNKLFVYCIPSLIGVATLTDHESLFESMQRWARLTVLLGIATYGFVYFYAGMELQYMVYSYFMLLPICVCYEHARMEGFKLDFLIGLAGSVSIVMCGARGAVVSLLMYFALRFMLGLSRRMTRKQLMQLLLLVALLLVLLFAYEQLLAMVADLFERLGIDSRFITRLANDTLLEDSGRRQITEAVFKGIRSNPVGYGLYGDRYVAGAFGFGDYRYVHNIVWEFLCDFGLFGGTLLLWMLMRRLRRTFGLLRDQQEMRLMMTLIPYGIFQLFFSSSFLENIPFFWIVGLSFFVNRKNVLSFKE